MKRNSILYQIAPVVSLPRDILRDAVQAVTTHPRRAVAIAAIFMGLLALVATTTLPMALAPTAPDLALTLNPREPEALTQTALRIRSRQLAVAAPSTSVDVKSEPASERQGSPSERPAAVPPDSIARLPEAPPPTATLEPQSGRASTVLNTELQTLAHKIIAVDPLNALPYRLLAEITQDQDERRELMAQAAKRSRRETQAAFWLLQDGVADKRFDHVIRQADILLRTRPEIQPQVVTLLAQLAEDPAGRPELIQWLARSPDWRVRFFDQLNRNITRADTPFILMQALTELGQPPSTAELNQYLAFLIEKKFPEYAYNVWLQALPPTALEEVGFIYNPSFERAPSGSPFDWRISTPRNAVGEFVPLKELSGRRAFHVSFGSGRIGFPELSQTLILPPGRYRLEGRLRGSIAGKRGLLWRVHCTHRPQPPLGQTEPLMGTSQTWRLFSFDFEVPNTPDCAAQSLRLFHDSRSPSEELLNGEMWFDDLLLQRIPGPKA